MTETKCNRINFWYGIFLSVFTVAVGILFLAEVADIYYSEGKFTSELIGMRFRTHVLAPFVIWIAAVIVAFVLSVVYPVSRSGKHKPDALKSLSRLRKKLPEHTEDLSEELKNDALCVRKFRLIRTVLWSITAAVCLASAIATCVYVFDKTHFTSSEYNTHMLDMAKFVLPFVAVSFACCIGTAIYEAVSAKYELPLVKKLVAANAAAAKQKEALPSVEEKSGRCAFLKRTGLMIRKNEKWILLGIRLAVFIVAIVFIGVGIANGGMDDVFIKAAKICTECIGLR